MRHPGNEVGEIRVYRAVILKRMADHIEQSADFELHNIRPVGTK